MRGGDMKAEIAKFIKTKTSHSNFLRAGWFQAIGVYARRIGKGLGKSILRQTAKIKGPSAADAGGATPARPGTRPFTTFWNTAFSRHTTTKEGVAIAEKGLALAIAKQVADMNRYIARKQKEGARKVFSRFLR